MLAVGTTLTVSVRDPEKLDFLLELLRGLPYAEVKVHQPSAEETTAAERAQLFLQTAGIWKDRNIDADDLRKRAWQRGNSGN